MGSVRPFPAHGKEKDHVLHSSVFGQKGQGREPRQEAAPPDASAELLAQSYQGTPRKEEKMKTVKDHDHLSYSQINVYLTCPLRYRFQYVEQIPPAFTAVSLAFGTGPNTWKWPGLLTNRSCVFTKCSIHTKSVASSQKISVRGVRSAAQIGSRNKKGVFWHKRISLRF